MQIHIMSRTSVLSLTAAVFPASNTTATTAKGILSSGEVKRGDWAAAYAIATALVAELTNQGKITIITGGSVDSAWTALAFKDGTHGVQGMIIFPPLSENAFESAILKQGSL
jgi:beta-glucosidase